MFSAADTSAATCTATVDAEVVGRLDAALAGM